MLFRAIFALNKDLPLSPFFLTTKLLVRKNLKAGFCVKKSTINGNYYEILGLTS